MKKFLVGGAVRDKLLGRVIKDRDWVVVGATADEMLAQGYQRVGRDFPVFLHPKTREEYALARSERKTGSGHTDFECHFDASVTLEDDLMRRDITINAIAMDEGGHLTDPYNGKKDLESHIIRHVSPAFVEDPLRVYRVARFKAMLPEFTISSDTLGLMKTIVKSGELSTLSKERIVMELRKSLLCRSPWEFFNVLQQVDVKDIYVLAFDTETAAKMSQKTRTDKELQSFIILLWGQSTVVAEGLLRLGLPQELKRVCETHVVWSDFILMSQHNLAAWHRVVSLLDAWRRPQLLQTILWYYDIVFNKDYGMKWQKMYAAYKAIKWPDVLGSAKEAEIVDRVSEVKMDLVKRYLV